MTLLLLGMCIVLFDVNLAVGNAYIGIFPDMIGYAMMAYALHKASDSSKEHAKLYKFCKLSSLAAAVIYILAVVGIGTVLEGWLWVALDLGSYVLESYVAYLVVALMRDRDSSVKGDIGKKLISAWRVSVLFGAVAFFSILSPASTLLLTGFSAVADISLVTACFKNAKHCVLV